MRWIYLTLLLALGAVMWGYRQYTEEALEVLFGVNLQGRTGQSVGQIANLQRGVQVKAAGKQYFVDAFAGMHLYPYDTVSTLAGSQARLVLGQGYALDLEENSTVVLKTLKDEGGAVALQVDAGGVGVTALNAEKPLQISDKKSVIRLKGTDQVKWTSSQTAEAPVVTLIRAETLEFSDVAIKDKQLEVNRSEFSLALQPEPSISAPAEEKTEKIKYADPHDPKNAGLSPKLSSKDIRKVLTRLIPNLKGCYDRFLNKSMKAPAINAAIRVKGATGSVSDVNIPNNAVEPEMRNCVTFYIKAAKFPRFLASEQSISLPIDLK